MGTLLLILLALYGTLAGTPETSQTPRAAAPKAESEAAPGASFLKLGMTYPLPMDAIRAFAQSGDR